MLNSHEMQTDNFYKIIAFSGLVILVLGIWKHIIDLRHHYHHQTSILHAIELSCSQCHVLNSYIIGLEKFDADVISKLTVGEQETLRAMTRAFQDLKTECVNETPERIKNANRVINDINQHKDDAVWRWILIVGGAATLILSSFFWYMRHQRYLNILIKSESKIAQERLKECSSHHIYKPRTSFYKRMKLRQ